MTVMGLLEGIGTIAFAISGALVGIKKEMDYFGILVLSITTALGGGVFRDILIGNTPPIALREPFLAILSMCCAIGTFYIYKKLYQYANIIQLFDAVGLGAFTAIGANVAFHRNLESPFIVITLGLLTGTGGGIIRDVFAREIPFVFQKEIYAVASIMGSITYLLTEPHFSRQGGMYACFFVTFIIRVVSIKYNLHLKKVTNKE